MTETLTSSAAVKWKAGANANATITADAGQMTALINQAEGVISTNSRVDWVDGYAGLSANYKLILDEVASNLAAMYVIQYDMSGFTSRYEAETMLDVLNNGVNRGMSLLRPQPQKDFVNGA